MSEIIIVPINDLKKGSYVIIEGVPSKVINISISKTGKHGHAKARIEAVGLLDDKKRVVVKPTSDRLEAPIVDKKSAQVLSIEGDKAQVMDSENYETFDLEIPEEFKDELESGMNVLYWNILNDKIIKQIKKD